MGHRSSMLPRRRFVRSLGAAISLIGVPGLGFAAAGTSVPASLLLAREADPGIDPAGYLVSEKFDGVRALWDGTVLRFRSGRRVSAPAWFTAQLPAQPLDGELWLARGRFEVLSGIVRRTVPRDDEWRKLHFLVFELPGAGGDFAARAEGLRRIVGRSGVPQLIAVAQRRVADRAALQRWLAEVVDAGGEGLVMHRADSPYHTGRSDALLKLKPAHDAEAVVVGHIAGHGKNAGQMGALQMRGADGVRFAIGTGFSDALRANPPPLGAIVTYRYRGATHLGVPRFASFLRVRDVAQ
ncbi:MAG: DNA ligase [Burkholderiaceae bacterium]